MPNKQWTKSVASQWGLFLPPARPSLSELVVIERFLLNLKKAKKNNFKMAILGSTPEYRDLGQQYSVDYKCIDYDADNFKTLRQFMLHKDDDKNLIIADWRDMNFDGRFDFWIGDLATTVTPVADHEKLFKNIKAHCNDSALILLKTPLRENDNQMSHKAIFELYRKKYFYLNPFAAVWHEVLLADYDFKNDAMNCQTSLAKLRESFNIGIINEHEFLEFKKRWDALGDFKMNIPLKQEFLARAEKYFKIKKIMRGVDWYRKWALILVFSL